MHQAQIGWRSAGQQLRRNTRCHLLGFLVEKIECRYGLIDKFSIAKSSGRPQWNCRTKDARRSAVFIKHWQKEQFARILHLVQRFGGEVYNGGIVISEHLFDQGADSASMRTVPHV